MLVIEREPDPRPSGCVDDCGSDRPIYRRGLTRACWHRHRDAGDLDDYPPMRTGPRTTLLVDAMTLRRTLGRPELVGRRGDCASRRGITWAQIAERLGVSFAALDKARERAGYPDVEDGQGPAPGRRTAAGAR